LIARRQDRLERLAQELIATHGIQVKTIALDLSRSDFLPQVSALTDSLDVGLLVNNGKWNGRNGSSMRHNCSPNAGSVYCVDSRWTPKPAHIKNTSSVLSA
jgi:hypothetical protein